MDAGITEDELSPKEEYPMVAARGRKARAEGLDRKYMYRTVQQQANSGSLYHARRGRADRSGVPQWSVGSRSYQFKASHARIGS